ncbi:RsmE family RNA methyltransferase [Ureaplasma miroungigenitalium]|uniref:Ribosomal RNA small subunit methyltransferase E n=1 Tax=Ureaplasma miroungigenitalium TaxID=1042321 RepID=A0ABT3BN87_9BACT|nr:RsmE family RNA methyltransferase [Ureaplasma miroungigenitalium]MCV3728696.1 RsmE family RNA methyltransferase [Ureaplasma miroungigenitalium]MCV3734460.1 RsmE family RNA methyltransferase [Ureaplasma miroungigenitalium]
MHQYLVKKIDKQKNVIFHEDDIFKITKVHRIKLYEEVCVLYNQEKFIAKITNLKPLTAEVVGLWTNIQRQYDLDVFLGSLKAKPFEDAINKLTQLNVRTCAQLILQRSYDCEQIKTERIHKIIETATNQAKRNDLMTFQANVRFQDLCEQINMYDAVFVAYENNAPTYIYDLQTNWTKLEKIAVVIGGEGGFSDTEITQLQTYKNVFCIKLSPTILRAETAAVYLCSVLDQYLNFQRRSHETKTN